MSEATIGSAPARREGASAAAASPAASREDGYGLIDRSRALDFTWNGRRFQGFQGDTLASALLAGGVKTVGRSFKYHRPRGVMSAGVEEAGALVSVGRGARKTPNSNAAVEELYDGLVAGSQNAWPSERFDIGALNNLFGRFFNAGFYYKTFFSAWPAGGSGTGHWMWFEKAIRRAAGMGRLSMLPDPDAYETAHAFADVLVVGSGPAGIEAALRLAEAGQEVVLAEQDFELGGRLLSDSDAVDGEAPDAWRRRKLAALDAAGVRVLPRTTVFGLYDGGVAGLVERVGSAAAQPAEHQPRQRVWILRVQRTVIAAGAVERAIAFGDNDVPGVMSAGAARTYLNRFGVLTGRRVVLATAHDGGYAAAADLAGAGAQVVVLDARAGAAARHEGGAADVVVKSGYAPLRAFGGRNGVASVGLARAEGDGWVEARESLGCDLLAVSGGWSPLVNLLSHRGAKPVWNAERDAFLPGLTDEPIEICGAAAGHEDASVCAASGRNAASRLLGRDEEDLPSEPNGHPRRALYEVKAPGLKLKSFVDPQHDVTTEDVRLAHREGYVSVEHLKRYTTLGMAADQGKMGNVIGLALMAEAQGRTIPEVGTTTFRPPYTPVAIGALAGRAAGAHFKPERQTPMHAWNRARGAVMTDAGLWKRPWYYPHAGEGVNQAYVREAAAVRETVGLCDVTSLGKIAVQGPDAAEFLNRIYVNGFAKLAVGRARYGVMLRDDGIVFDDGTVWRLGEHDYFMTTTTAGAGKVMSWLEELLQVRWPELNVAVTSVSERWAGFSIAGPLARRVLEYLVKDVDFSDAAFPFMGVREGHVGQAPCRIARISFSGELAYEIYVESDYGQALAEALWDAAEPQGGVLYGTEALGAMRIEKGHVAGAELDGRTTLADLGLEGMASSKKPFIGKVLAQREETASAFRERLVGLVPEKPGETFKGGAILTTVTQQTDGGDPTHGIGWVSSVTHSPALGHWIGLGLVQGGLEVWRDKTVMASDPVRNSFVRVRVVSPHMHDAKGARMKPEADPALPAALDRPPRESLARRSALGADRAAGDEPRAYGRAEIDEIEDPGRAAQDRPAWIVEGAPQPLWQLTAHAGFRADAEALLLEISGAESAPAPGRFSEGEDEIRILRVGPLTWWATGLPPEEAERLSLADQTRLAPLELSHGYARFRIGGPEAATLLNRFLPIDLRERRFPVGAAATTQMHHTPVTLARIDANAYDLWAPRSYAASFWDLLEETPKQF